MNFNKYKSEIKKYENLIRQSEHDRAEKINRRKLNYSEYKSLEADINQLKKDKDEISNLIKQFETSKSLKSSEFNRKKADLRYKTPIEYDDMISKLQNDMNNNSKYNKNDEIRLLNQINQLKREKIALSDLTQFKIEVEKLTADYDLKKTQQHDLQKKINSLNDKKIALYHESLNLKKDIDAKVKLIDEYKLKLNEIKFEYTRQVKNRQEYHKRIVFKKLQQDDFNSNAFKITEQISKHEEDKRDCLRLIKFLENFKSNTNVSTISNDTSSTLSSFCSETSRLSSSTHATNNTNNSNLSLNNSLEENCFIIYRKKDDDYELTTTNSRFNKQKRTKSNQLQKTISYTLNELTLFSKLNIKEPKNILQIDDALTQLNYKKDECNAKIESLGLELKELEDYFNSKDELNDLINNIVDCDDDLNQDLIKSSIETLETIQQASEFIDIIDKSRRKSSNLIYSDTNSEISNFDFAYQSSITSSINDINNSDTFDDKLLSNSQKTSSDDGSDSTTIVQDIKNDNTKCTKDSTSSSSDRESPSSTTLSRKSSLISRNDAVLGLKNTLNLTQVQLNKINLQQEQFSDGYGSPGSQMSTSSNENNVYFQQQK